MTNIHTEHKAQDQPGEPGHDGSGPFLNSGPGNGGNNVPPHHPSDRNEAPRPEGRPWYKRPVAMVAGGLATAVVAAGGAGVLIGRASGQSNNDHETGSRPTTGQSIEPAPTPIPTPSPSAIQSTEQPSPIQSEAVKPPQKDDSANIEYMRGLDIAVFNKLPREERLKLAAWEAYRTDQGDHHAYFTNSDQAFIPPNPTTGYPGEFLDSKNPYNSVFPEKGASKFDDGQKIMDQALFWDQMFNAQAPDQNGVAGPLDHNRALQIMGATRSYYVDKTHPEQTKGTYDEQAHFIEQTTVGNHLAVTERYIATHTSPTMLSGEDVEGNPILYKDVEYVSHGNSYVARFVFETVTIQVTNPQTDVVEPLTINMWVTYSDVKKPAK